MSKVRVNFYLPLKIYSEVQLIAEEEATTSAEIFRKAIKSYLREYRLGTFGQRELKNNEQKIEVEKDE
jgi:metal-responsive CopG/Arc/MetJ family transcriptional regulator